MSNFEYRHKFNFTSHAEVPTWVREYVETVSGDFFKLSINEINVFLNELDQFEATRPAYEMAS
jgi:hypothetical protein